MKVLLLTVLVLGAALAEPAFRRQQSQQAQQQDADDSAPSGPYAPSGWKPSGQRLEYEAPEAPETDEDTTTETPQTPVEPKSEKQPLTQGEYHVILPDGRLQRVQFAAKLESPPASEPRQDADEPVRSPRPGVRPVPRPAPRPQAQGFPAAQLEQQRVERVQYFVVLPDGSLQQAQIVGRFEAERGEVPASDPAGPAAAPQGGVRRPKPHPQQVAVMPPQGVPAAPSSFVAELRFMEVPPVTGPVFSYSGPLVRVQREAWE